MPRRNVNIWHFAPVAILKWKCVYPYSLAHNLTITLIHSPWIGAESLRNWKANDIFQIFFRFPYNFFFFWDRVFFSSRVFIVVLVLVARYTWNRSTSRVLVYFCDALNGDCLGRAYTTNKHWIAAMIHRVRDNRHFNWEMHLTLVFTARPVWTR